MALTQQAENLVDTTVTAFNGDVTSISPFDGISLIDTWVSALRSSDQSTNPVVSGLSDLKAELQSGNPDGSHIQSILEDLADQVKQAANSAEDDVKRELTPLSEALQGFSQQLGGSSKMADAHNQQAPMTSTVGGESTTSGTGASAFYTNTSDDLSNRNGGVVAAFNGDDDEPATGMDDPTGSDGGSGGMDPDNEPSETAENNSAMGMDDDTGSEGGMHPPSKSSSGSGSTGDDYGTNSNTQRSGVSGGSADSGSGSSGGRSQY